MSTRLELIHKLREWKTVCSNEQRFEDAFFCELCARAIELPQYLNPDTSDAGAQKAMTTQPTPSVLELIDGIRPILAPKEYFAFKQQILQAVAREVDAKTTEFARDYLREREMDKVCHEQSMSVRQERIDALTDQLAAKTTEVETLRETLGQFLATSMPGHGERWFAATPEFEAKARALARPERIAL